MVTKGIFNFIWCCAPSGSFCRLRKNSSSFRVSGEKKKEKKKKKEKERN